MNLRARAASFLVRAAARLVSNHIDAGQRFSRDRGAVPGWLQDARLDLSTATREEVLRKARYFAANSPLVQRMSDVFVQYTVGPRGLRFTPASSDLEWNRLATESFRRWSEVCDISTRFNFAQFQGMAADRWYNDGEVFIIKTNGGAPFYRPRLQMIEAHRVATPWEKVVEQNVQDGVELNIATGRPVAYWVRDSFLGDTFRRIPAKRMVHIFTPDRPGQLRGLPFYTSVLNLLSDFQDLQRFEMLAAKVAASIATIIKRKNGEALTPEQLRKVAVGITETKSDGSTYTKQREERVKSVIGGEALVLEPGDDIQQFRSDRPSVITREYWEFLTHQICAGGCVSKSLIFPYSLQGTVARGELDVNSAFFRGCSDLLQRSFAEAYSYAMQDEIFTDAKLGARVPVDWFKVNVRPPRTPNVDAGRNSSAMLSEYDAGARSLTSICAEQGDEFFEVAEEKAKEAKFIRDLAAEYGVDPSEISNRIRSGMLDQLPSRSGPEKALAA